jgi:universal stress protein E
MKRFKKILVAIDTRCEHHPLLDTAEQIAQLNQASLKIVDVLPSAPWLVKKTMPQYDEMMALMKKTKSQALNQLAEPIVQKGINVETELLSGKTSVELTREALRGKYDLLIAMAKGKNSKNEGSFGQTAKRLLRMCPCPVWLVTEKAKKELKHIMGCFDTSTNEPIDIELNEKVYELCQVLCKYNDGKFSMVHAWSIWNEGLLRAEFTAEEFAQQMKSYEELVNAEIDQFIARQDAKLEKDHIHALKGETADVIPQFASEKNVDLIVMGTVARAGVSGFLMGNTAEQILNKISCSVLALKPANFRCPVTAD